MTDFVVVGCGSIGRRHIRNLISLKVGVLATDVDRGRLQEAIRLGATPVRDLEEAIKSRPAAGIVCTPPHLHAEVALPLLAGGADVFVEKPIAHELPDARGLVEYATRHHKILYVGYNLRFHPGLQRLSEFLTQSKFGRPLSFKIEFGQYLPDWRPSEDYRRGYNTRRAEGGGIILDASHEIDYLLWLAGEVESVHCEAAHVSGLEMDAEDVAAITLRTRQGAIAEIHVDCVQRRYTRSCKVICESGTMLWDFKRGLTCVGPDGSEYVAEGTTVEDINRMYLDEMSHFVACVGGDASPVAAGIDAVRVLEIALAARTSAATGERISV